MFGSVVDVIILLISRFSNRNLAFSIAFSILGATLLVWAVATLRPHIVFRRAMRQGIAKARAAGADAVLRPEDRLANMDASLQTNPVLGESWRPYRAALREDPRREGHYLNPIDPHSWFALERLPGRGYEKWSTTFAGVSLTVGLLFTFIGLSAALFEVGRAGANTAELRQAIARILDISAAKFITSIAGIIAYIWWTIAARCYASAQGKLARSFASAVQKLTAPVNPEALLLDQLDEARTQTDRLKTLSDDLAVAFDKSLTSVVGTRLDSLPAHVGELLRPALVSTVEPVIDAIKNVGGALGASNTTALETMIGRLLNDVRGAAGNEMDQLARTIRDAAQELKDARSGIGDSGAAFAQTLAQAASGMDAAAQRMASSLEARLSTIGTALDSGAQHIDAMGSKLTHATQEGLKHALETIAASAGEGARLARNQAEAELGPMLGALKTMMDEIRTAAGESSGALSAGVRGAANAMTTASAEASRTLLESFEGATRTILEGIGTALTGYQTATTGLAARLEAVERGFTTLQQSVQRSAGQLDTTSSTLSAAGGAVGTAADGLRRAAEPVAATLRTLEGSATATREAVLTILQGEAAMREAAVALNATAKAAADAFTSYRDRFAGVDESLQTLIERLRQGVVQIGEETARAVGAYDEHLGRAISNLANAVEEIKETTEHLAEALEDARGAKRIPVNIT